MSHAKTLVPPAKERVLRAAARVYGEKCSGLSAKYDRGSYSLRTYLLCVSEALTGFSLHWNESATPAGHWWLVLGRLGPRTNGTGCGSLGDWPTPRSSENENRTTKPAPSHGKTHGKCLAGEVGLQESAWPTPASRDWRDDGHAISAQERHSPCLPASVVLAGQPDQDSHSTNGNKRGSLNSAWVAQLMGMPENYFAALQDAVMEYHAKDCLKGNWKLRRKQSLPKPTEAA